MDFQLKKSNENFMKKRIVYYTFCLAVRYLIINLLFDVVI